LHRQSVTEGIHSRSNFPVLWASFDDARKCLFQRILRSKIGQSRKADLSDAIVPRDHVNSVSMFVEFCEGRFGFLQINLGHNHTSACTAEKMDACCTEIRSSSAIGRSLERHQQTVKSRIPLSRTMGIEFIQLCFDK